MDFRERLEKTLLAITLAEAGKHEWARKVLTKLDEESLHRGEPAAKLVVIELYLQSLCERSGKIEEKKFYDTEHYLILVKDLAGRVKHHLIFGSQFLAENTLVEIIEKLTSWHLEDVLRKAGEKVILVSDRGFYVPCLGGLNLWEGATVGSEVASARALSLD